MLAEQDQLAKEIKVSPEIVKLIMAEVGMRQLSAAALEASAISHLERLGTSSRRPWSACSA